jgi:ABC-2 type transport system ATP-binding protein
LFCDETFDGLDPVMRQLVKRLFAEEVAERQMTVILASHNLRELEDICDHVALLHKGKLLFQQDLDDMKLSLQKIQTVFAGNAAEIDEQLKQLPLLNMERRGSMVTLVARGTREELDSRLRALHPTFYEFIPLTLEEIFISEMGDRGYDFAHLLA